TDVVITFSEVQKNSVRFVEAVTPFVTKIATDVTTNRLMRFPIRECHSCKRLSKFLPLRGNFCIGLHPRSTRLDQQKSTIPSLKEQTIAVREIRVPHSLLHAGSSS